MMDKLNELFKHSKIKYIVSVDNCYDKSTESDDFEIIKYCVENLGFFKEFCKEFSRGDILETLESLNDEAAEFIESIIKDLNTSEKDSLQKKVPHVLNNEVVALTKFCTDLVENNSIIIDFKKFSSIETANNFYSKIEDHFTLNDDSRVLWLIDNNFEDSGGTSEDGQNFIKKIITSGNTQNHVFALCSAQEEIGDNNQLREIFTIESLQNISLACLIKKRHILDEDYAKLFSEMYLGFRQNYSGEILSQLNHVLDTALKKSAGIMSELQDETINKVILLGSMNDGVSPVETFQRLMMIIIQSDIVCTIGTKFDSISKLIHNYHELCKWCAIDLPAAEDFRTIEDLRSTECYDMNINILYSAVGYGDIFSINNKYYLLLSQACNISIRSNGERKARCATLLEIVTCDPGRESSRKIDYFPMQTESYVSFNNAINIDFTVLDLCSLNNNGKLFINDEFDYTSTQFRYSESFFKHLQNVIEHNKHLQQQYLELSHSMGSLSLDDVIKKTRELYKDNSLELIASFNNGVLYNGERVCRVNKDIMDDISKKYAEYHSRKALDFDFAKKYKIIPYSVTYFFNFDKLRIHSDDIKKLHFFNYYNTDETVDESKVHFDFKNFYRDFYKLDSSVDIPKKDFKFNEHRITIQSKFIPVVIEDKIHINVLNVNDDKITIKVPKILIDSFIDSSQTRSIISSDYNSSIKLSQKDASFTFDIDQPFKFKDNSPEACILELKFEIKDGILKLLIEHAEASDN